MIVARMPAVLQAPAVDLADSETTRKRLCILEFIDRMAARGKRRGDTLLAAGTYYGWRGGHLRGGLKALRAAPARAEPGTGSGPSKTAAWSRPSAAASPGLGARPSTPSSAETPASH